MVGVSAWAPPPPMARPRFVAATDGTDALVSPGAGGGGASRWRAVRNIVAAFVAAGGAAGVVALASRAGGLPGDADPGLPARHELVPRVVLGTLLAAGAAFGVAFLLHLRFAARTRTGRRRGFGGMVRAGAPLFALAAGFGALAGASTTPLRQHGAITRDAGFTLTARPVDDGAGRPAGDAQGRAVLGLDLDGDGRIDRVLPECPGAQALTVDQVVAASQPGAGRVQVVVDTDCDGVPERVVYLDPRPAPLAPEAIGPGQASATPVPIEVLNRSTDRLRTVIAALAVTALAALAGLVVAALVLALRGTRLRLSNPEHAATVVRAGSDAFVDRSRVAEAFGESIDAMLTDSDPHTGIIGAYAKLLDGLSRAGLPRRSEEAPLEHLGRCMDALQVPADPMERLTELFVLARFSTHSMHDGHRLDALNALRAALGHLSEQPDPFVPGRRR